MDTKEFTLVRISHAPPTKLTPKKTVPCAGCEHRFCLRDLVELHEDNHDALTYFHRDRLCEKCAGKAGVIR